MGESKINKVCETPRYNCGCYLDNCVAMNDLFRTFVLCMYFIVNLLLGSEPSCFIESLGVQFYLRWYFTCISRLQRKRHCFTAVVAEGGKDFIFEQCCVLYYHFLTVA